jgi:hypothetical protein
MAKLKFGKLWGNEHSGFLCKGIPLGGSCSLDEQCTSTFWDTEENACIMTVGEEEGNGKCGESPDPEQIEESCPADPKEQPLWSEFSAHGQAVIRALNQFDRGVYWDAWDDTTLAGDAGEWILQSPPEDHWGQPASSDMAMGTTCTQVGVDITDERCNDDYGLVKCNGEEGWTVDEVCGI